MNKKKTIKIEPILSTGNFVGFHRVSNNFTNLSVKVVFRKLSASEFLFDKLKHDPEFLILAPEKPHGSVEERIITWQQKISSPRSPNNSTEENSDEGDTKDESSGCKSHLYTYTNDDLICGDVEISIPTLTSKKDQEYMLKKLKKMHIRHNINCKAKSEHQLEYPQTMYIMADIGSSQNTEEAMLCMLTAHANGMLSVYPDFSSEPYKLRNSENQQFDYLVEYIRREVDDSLLPKKYETRRPYSMKIEPPLFNKTYPFSMIVHGQIVSASAFPQDNLFIHYLISLPSCAWGSDCPESLSGVTHTCSTKSKGFEDLAYFGFPFEAELHSSHDQSRLLTEGFPQLLLCISSSDNWQVLGYAWTPLLPTPGTFAHRLITWNPVVRDSSTHLHNFFIGSTTALSSMEEVTLPPSAKHHQMASKLGQMVATAGMVRVTLSVVTLLPKDPTSLTPSCQDLTGIQAPVRSDPKSVTQVIDAFKKAREKMLKTRELIHNLRK